LPWQFFSNALSESSGSLVSNANLISKVYFPRMIVPAGAVIVGFVDFLISFVIMAALMVWYGFAPGIQILTLPLWVGHLLVVIYIYSITIKIKKDGTKYKASIRIIT
jgi:lipopolysaccharide transport system permease protein